jgi:predicted amidophosphoribosyltransferase
MPRSSPLSANNALWPSLRICEELLKQGLALDILPVVVREKTVTKAATAGSGKRPGPAEHYESCRVNLKQLPFIAARITLVDDVITQGSTFLGIYPLVQEAFSRSKINCFALIRTMSGVSIDAMLDPVRGKIIFAQGTFLRNP